MERVYPTGKTEETVVFAPGHQEPRLVKFHQSFLARHIYIVDSNSKYGKDYNPWSILLLKKWLQGVTVEVLERTYTALERILRHTERLLPNYLDNVGSVCMTNDMRVFVDCAEGDVPSLKQWKIDGFHIIFGDQKKNKSNHFTPKVIDTSHAGHSSSLLLCISQG